MYKNEFELIQEYPSRKLLFFAVIFNDHYAIMEGRKTKKVHFMYSVSDEMSFDFSLLCECNKAAHSIFKKELKDKGLKIKTVETENDYYEVLIHNKKGETI